MQGSMFLFGSALPSEAFVRLPDRSFHLQPVRFAYFHYTISFSLSNIGYFVASFWDCSVIEESFLTGFLQQVKNPKCEPDEYGIKYLPVMRQAMCIEGRKVLEAGVDAMDLKDGIYMAFEAIKGHLKCRARVASRSDKIDQVGRTAANEDKRIDVLLTEVMEKVGKEGLFIIYDEEKKKNELKFLRGMKLNWGAVSSFFIDDETQTCVLKNPKVLINENKISKKIVKQAIGPIGYKQPLFIIAEDVEVEVAGSLILDRICVSTKFCLVEPPEFEENCKGIMQDLAVLTGGWVVSAESNSLLARLKLGS